MLKRQYKTFSSIADFNSAPPNWGLDFRQARPGPSHASLESIVAPGILINLIHIDQPVVQRGSAPQNYFTFGFLHPGSPSLDWCGNKISDRTFERFGIGGEFNCQSMAGFHVTTVSIQQTEVGDSSGLISVGQSQNAEILAPDSAILDNIRGVLERLLQTARQVETPSRELIFNGHRADLLVVLDQAHGGQRKMSRTSRSRVRNAALSYMHANARETFSIGQLCQRLEISWRQLDYAFKDHFEMTPKSYLKRLRLEGLHQDLLAASSPLTVTSLASGWGFTHFGQMAKDYKNLFGESPSKTLQR